ncbi:MAG: hypothetical protein JSW48_12615 [Betaproteobacteria bacterium]|nr:MAG: hypothetical protein JSW48_12615 [Betaproteobacteria bacterium]
MDFRLCFWICQIGRNGCGDTTRNVILNREDILQFAIVAVRAEVIVHGRVYQLRRDSDPATDLTYASLDHVAHTQRRKPQILVVCGPDKAPLRKPYRLDLMEQEKKARKNPEPPRIARGLSSGSHGID